jgi:NADPH:quinone reductase-like Zn-dependent oxidoreductase
MPQLPAVMEQFLGWKMPFTLGHEVGGWIDALGAGVSGFEEGQPVAIVSTRSCGHCLECDSGFDNACDWNKLGRGYGMNGGIADYLDRRELAPDPAPRQARSPPRRSADRRRLDLVPRRPPGDRPPRAPAGPRS